VYGTLQLIRRPHAEKNEIIVSMDENYTAQFMKLTKVCVIIYFWNELGLWLLTRDGILGHQFDKRRESLAPMLFTVPSWWISVEK
jgi:hypothetical protein